MIGLLNTFAAMAVISTGTAKPAPSISNTKESKEPKKVAYGLGPDGYGLGSAGYGLSSESYRRQ